MYEKKKYRSVDALVFELVGISSTYDVKGFVSKYEADKLAAHCVVDSFYMRSAMMSTFDGKTPSAHLIRYAFVAASLLQLTQHPRMQQPLIRQHRQYTRRRDILSSISHDVCKLSKKWSRARCRRESLVSLFVIQDAIENESFECSCSLMENVKLKKAMSCEDWLGPSAILSIGPLQHFFFFWNLRFQCACDL
jgi:hypothetical protein